MEYRPEDAGVFVERTDAGWIVRVTERGATTEHDFAAGDAAEEFAHSQRLRLGIVPQQDVS